MTLKSLLELLSENSELPIHSITTVMLHEIERTLNTYPDPDIISHDKHTDKEYFLEDEFDLHDEFPFILSAYINEFGFHFDGELFQDLGQGRDLRYSIHDINKRLAQIKLRGVLNGGYGEIDEEAVCRIKILAISKSEYAALSLHETLAIEAYLLLTEGNYKMAFFTYFSAAEAALRVKIDIIKSEIYEELHNSIEHLAFDEKIRIAGKHTFKTKELCTVPLWGDFMGILRDCKTTRNSIAHGLKAKVFIREDVDKAAACYIVTQQALLNGSRSMKDIVNIYKPKKRKRS